MFLSDTPTDRFAASFAGGICALLLPLLAYVAMDGLALAGGNILASAFVLAVGGLIAYFLRASRTMGDVVLAVALAVAIPLSSLAALLVLDPALAIAHPSISVPDLPSLAQVPHGAWLVAALFVGALFVGARYSFQRIMSAVAMTPVLLLGAFLVLAVAGGAIPGTPGSSSPAIRQAAQHGLSAYDNALQDGHEAYVDRGTSLLSKAR